MESKNIKNSLYVTSAVEKNNSKKVNVIVFVMYGSNKYNYVYMESNAC